MQIASARPMKNRAESKPIRELKLDVRYTKNQFAMFFALYRARKPESTPGVRLGIHQRYGTLTIYYHDECLTQAYKDELLAIINEFEARWRNGEQRLTLDTLKVPPPAYMPSGKGRTKAAIRAKHYRQ